MSKIPHFYQETEYTCGPACMKMILRSMGYLAHESELEKLLETNNKVGTPPEKFKLILKEYDLEIFEKEKCTIDEIQSLIKDGWKVIVQYSVEVPHFAIVSKINESHIFLHDPAFGPDIAYTKGKFFRKWNTKISNYNNNLPYDKNEWKKYETEQAIIAFKDK